MNLPPSIAPWREQLELFPEAIAVQLGPLLQRLELAIGPLLADSRHDDGDPDGFNGIARRGTYERLLISEWLLAEEVPEEFTRRALAGEHAFLQVARRTHATARLSAALFDGGPDQWGSPRIAHLAALIVLARRAEAAGVPFSWGMLQQDPAEPRSGVTPANVQALLNGRTCRRAAPADLERWTAALGTPGPADELWLVGGARAGALGGSGTSILDVTDPLDPGQHAVVASVAARGASARSVTLPLPEPRICSRLLRDPFEVHVAVPQRVKPALSPASNLVFSASGSKVFARGQDGTLLAYPIPNSPRAGAGRPKVLQSRSEGEVLAVGRLGKSTLLVSGTRDFSRIHFEVIGGSSLRIPEGPIAFEGMQPPPLGALEFGESSGFVPGLPPLGTITASWLEGGTEAFVVLGETLLLITNRELHSRSPVARVLETGVVACAPVPNGIAWITIRADGWHLTTRTGKSEPTTSVREGSGTRAYIGYGAGHADPDYGVLALETGDGTWHVQNGDGVRTMTQWPGTDVVGVVATPSMTRAPALVFLEADRKKLTVHGVNSTISLPPTETPIAYAAASPTSSRIAYSTADGGLVVYSVEDQAVLYRLTPEGQVAS
ncbi:MAG: hypothetical protein K0Q72_1898 [Armatimonadetes bacterium]|nr:hypothetical protein [Armatimonadota bacterium]